MGAQTVAAILLAGLTIGQDCNALPRSPTIRAEFVRAHPCPATGKPRGACAGWEVDHVTPLKCGGADTAENMQWLTIEEHRAKTKREVKWCRAPRR